MRNFGRTGVNDVIKKTYSRKGWCLVTQRRRGLHQCPCNIRRELESPPAMEVHSPRSPYGSAWTRPAQGRQRRISCLLHGWRKCPNHEMTDALETEYWVRAVCSVGHWGKARLKAASPEPGWWDGQMYVCMPQETFTTAFAVEIVIVHSLGLSDIPLLFPWSLICWFISKALTVAEKLSIVLSICEA